MAAFTPGNIIVYRIGGTTSAAAAVFLDEYNSAGVLQQSIALPTTTAGNQDELTDSGQATYSGEITESATGSILTTGYDATTGTASVSGTSVPRVIGIVSAAGTVDTSTATTSYPTVRFTGAASADNQNIYVATGSGVGYTTFGSTGAATTLTSTVANEVAIANGNLYYSTPTSPAGIYQLGAGLPTTAGQASTLVAASTKPVAFAFASLGGGAADTLYVADNTNGIEKFSFVNGAYTATGTVAAAGAQGIGVTVVNGVATLYVTTNVTSGGTTTSTIRSLVDSSGAGGTLTGTPATVVTAPTGNVFKNDVVYQQAAPCYCTGTLIRTARGDVATEQLVVGDLVVTASGEHRPIRWIGSRLTHPRRHARPNEAQPIRISAHAFGENRPARDLRVSPGHSLCVDVVGEVLIPAGVLVNGTTITREDVDHVTYWHVELDSHDILLAENMPAESYIEMGNRGFFAENGVVALDASPDAPVVTHADFCRPFHAEGALVEVVRAQLAIRATQLGWRLEELGLDDFHLLVDGVRVEPSVHGLSARFAVPAGARAVWLVSDTTVPAEIAAGSPDRRSLGVRVAALVIDDGSDTPDIVPLDDPRLCVGFHEVERDGDAAWRWTAGRARLPVSLLESLEGDVFLRVDLAGPALPRWVAPACPAEDEVRPVALSA